MEVLGDLSGGGSERVMVVEGLKGVEGEVGELGVIMDARFFFG